MSSGKNIPRSKARADQRKVGRPRSVVRDTAVERAMTLFWTYGYHSVDMERIADDLGVTKPSLYRTFGDKATLFDEALKHYAQTIAAPVLDRFDAEPDVVAAIDALIAASVAAATSVSGGTGCFMVTAVAAGGDQTKELQRFHSAALSALTDAIEHRFAIETKAGRLRSTVSNRARALLLVDAVQGLLVRARSGASQKKLLEDARSYSTLVLA